MPWTKRDHQSQLIKVLFFRLLSALMKVNPIRHAIFETTRSGFVNILDHCSMSWKITPLYFCRSKLVYFGQKEPIKKKFSEIFRLLSGCLEIHRIPDMSYLKLQNSFSLNFASLFSVIRDNSSVPFSWNFIWFGQKKSIKVQNFRLSIAHMKFHQIRTLIGSFYWKYIQFQPKAYREFMSRDTEDWWKIHRKTDLLFQKWQEFGEFWHKHLKFLKISVLIGSFSAKYVTFDPKVVQRSYISLQWRLM